MHIEFFTLRLMPRRPRRKSFEVQQGTGFVGLSDLPDEERSCGMKGPEGQVVGGRKAG